MAAAPAQARSKVGTCWTDSAIAAALRELAELHRFVGGPPHRPRAYQNAARSIEASQNVERLVADRRLTELPGVGASIARLVNELVVTGTAKSLETLRARVPHAMLALARVPGVTPKTARRLVQELGLTSVADLEAALREHRVQTLRGFGPATESRLLDAVRAHARRGHDVTWSQAEAIVAPVAEWLTQAACIQRVEPSGAYRRLAETMDVVELVAVAAEPAEAFARLEAYPRAVHTEQSGSVMEMHLGDGARVRVHVAAPADFVRTWFRSTGPDAHVARIEQLGGFVRGARSEEDVYRAAGAVVVPPELRDDVEALAQARAGGNFDDLVTASDIRGIVHCHSTHSDGKNSILELALAAEDLGFDYLTITDHSPAAHYAGGVDVDRIERQWDEIASAQEQTRVKLLRGTESDILADGALDYPDRILEKLDVVIASIHSRMRMDRGAITRRIERCMELPVFKIWGHPLGRLLLMRDPVDCDVPRILDVIARSPAAVEINGDPRRLDLPPEWIREARRRGIGFVLSTDAHSVRGIGYLRFAVAVARRGGVRRGEVLNAMAPGDFAARVRPLV